MENETSRAEFDRYAEDYSGGMENPIKRIVGQDRDFFIDLKVKWMLEYIKKNRLSVRGTVNRMSLLDFGCGTGDFIGGLIRYNYDGHIKGCDVSEKMIKQAMERFGKKGPAFHLMKSDDIPFEADSFDISVACCVFHHIYPSLRRNFYSELKRVTKPGGYIFIFEHNPYNPLTRMVVKNTYIDKKAVLLTAKEVRVSMRDAGMTDIRAHYIFFFPLAFRNTFMENVENMLSWFPLGGQYAVVGKKPLRSIN